MMKMNMNGNQIECNGGFNFYDEKDDIKVMLFEFLTTSGFDIDQIDVRMDKIVVDIDLNVIKGCFRINLRKKGLLLDEKMIDNVINEMLIEEDEIDHNESPTVVDDEHEINE